jgi:hypothetical protein
MVLFFSNVNKPFLHVLYKSSATLMFICLFIYIEEGGEFNKRGKCRSKMKRSASEMESAYIVNEETFKRSKLVAALKQQSRGLASFSFSSLTTGPTSLTIRKEHQYQGSLMGGCSTWDLQQQQQQQLINDPVVGLPSQSLSNMMQHKPLPDLSKELSILPLLSDCSSNSGESGVNSTNNKDLCCSVGSVSSGATSTSSWMSGGSGDNHLPLPQSSFESCDSGWMGADDSYDLNTWKNLQNTNINNGVETLASPPLSSNSSSGFFDTTEATPVPDMLINNHDIYSPDDFIPNNNNSSSVTNYNTDIQLLLPIESTNCFQDGVLKQNPSTSTLQCESLIQQTQSFQQTPQFQQSSMQNGNVSNIVCSESRGTSTNDCCYNFDCYQLGGPFFRIQKPGNPTSVFVPSGRNLTLSTFCNMLPRVASYVQ